MSEITVNIGDTFWRGGAGYLDDGTQIVAELIYTGFANQTVFVSYREFSNGTARDAFHLELRYGFSGSAVECSFRSLLFLIQQASPSWMALLVPDDAVIRDQSER